MSIEHFFMCTNQFSRISTLYNYNNYSNKEHQDEYNNSGY